MRYAPAFSLLLCLSFAAHAQDARPLGQATGRASESFSAIAGFVELRDGRVLVADSRETALRLVDLSSGAVTQVSREGAAPTEYVPPAAFSSGQATASRCTTDPPGAF
jgi:hypothetical protein